MELAQYALSVCLGLFVIVLMGWLVYGVYLAFDGCTTKHTPTNLTADPVVAPNPPESQVVPTRLTNRASCIEFGLGYEKHAVLLPSGHSALFRVYLRAGGLIWETSEIYGSAEQPLSLNDMEVFGQFLVDFVRSVRFPEGIQERPNP